jgi:hypothetical protein
LAFKTLVKIFQLSVQQVIQIASCWDSGLGKREFTNSAIKAHYATVTDEQNNIGVPHLSNRTLYKYLHKDISHGQLGLVRAPGYTADGSLCFESLYSDHDYLCQSVYTMGTHLPQIHQILRTLIWDAKPVLSAEEHTFYTSVLCDLLIQSPTEEPFEKILIVQHLNYLTGEWYHSAVGEPLIDSDILHEIQQCLFGFTLKDIYVRQFTMEELLFVVAPKAFVIRTASMQWCEKFIVHPDALDKVSSQFSVNLFAFIRMMVAPHDWAGSFFTIPMMAFLKLQIVHKQFFTAGVTVDSDCSSD